MPGLSSRPASARRLTVVTEADRAPLCLASRRRVRPVNGRFGSRKRPGNSPDFARAQTRPVVPCAAVVGSPRGRAQRRAPVTTALGRPRPRGRLTRASFDRRPLAGADSRADTRPVAGTRPCLSSGMQASWAKRSKWRRGACPPPLKLRRDLAVALAKAGPAHAAGLRSNEAHVGRPGHRRSVVTEGPSTGHGGAGRTTWHDWPARSRHCSKNACVTCTNARPSSAVPHPGTSENAPALAS